jgi:hypothetical protein
MKLFSLHMLVCCNVMSPFVHVLRAKKITSHRTVFLAHIFKKLAPKHFHWLLFQISEITKSFVTALLSCCHKEEVY